MSQESVLRKHLAKLFRWKDAHADFDAALADLPPQLRGARAGRAPHTPWQLLEHMRIAQRDILEFSRNPNHVSPKFPEEYWPATDAPPNDAAWKKSLAAFRADLKAIEELVVDPSTDLFAPIPHGEGQTILREVLLVADHNSYHLGQLILLRRLLGAWQ